MTERILVTGGAGYLGSILVPALLRSGYQVTVLDNFMYRENSLAALCASERFGVVGGDVRDVGLMRELLAAHDIIIPLAAIVGAPACARDPFTATGVNLEAPLSLFREAAKSQRILMPTTNSAYGKGEAGAPCTEKSPLRPLSLYSRHKVEVEEALMARENSVSFRLATVFGMSPRMRLDLLVNDFVYRAVHDRAIVLFEAGFRRNFLHVRDVARAFVFALDHFDEMRGEIFNVGLDEANLTKRELCDRIREEIPGFSIHESTSGSDPDQRDYVVSSGKIHGVGFRPEFDLKLGIRELIKGYAMIRNSRFGNI